jgi:hypothetical protein
MSDLPKMYSLPLLAERLNVKPIEIKVWLAKGLIPGPDAKDEKGTLLWSESTAIAIEKAALPKFGERIGNAKPVSADGVATVNGAQVPIFKAAPAAPAAVSAPVQTKTTSQMLSEANALLATIPATPAQPAALVTDLKAQWDSDPKLQAEFGKNFGAFEAFTKAAARGQVRVTERKQRYSFTASDFKK